MSAIQLGEKQINFDDLETVIFGDTHISVDNAFLNKIQKVGKGKHLKVNCVNVEEVGIDILSGVSKTTALFSVLSLLKGEGISSSLVNSLINVVNGGNDCCISVFSITESVKRAMGEGSNVSDLEKEQLNKLSPLTTALCYLIFKEGEKLDDLILGSISLILSTLQADLSTLAENIYEIDRPHHCAAYVAQMLRLMLFGASSQKTDHTNLVQVLPELLGPMYDLLKQLKLGLQAELNAPAMAEGSAILLSHAANITYQYSNILQHLSSMMRCVGDDKAVEVIRQQYEENSRKLENAPPSLAIPYRLLILIHTVQLALAAADTVCIGKLQQLIAASTTTEEKTIDPEIEARLAAERAKEEAELDAATLERIREKRAAKEAKKSKKSSGKKEKKMNVGGGVAALMDEIVRLCPSLSVDAVATALSPVDGPLADVVSQLFESLKSGGIHRKPKIPKGTRDFLPEQMEIRSRVMASIRHVFKLHGAVEIDTPVFEEKETLMGKYGEDSKLIYDLADQGGEILSLRYDLTVPFARFLAVHACGNIKRFHIAKVYRRDNPVVSKGRYREFYQCDFDVAGSYGSMISDADVLAVGVEIYRALEIGEFSIKVNHRELLDSMMDICGVPANKIRAIGSAIDKLDKETWETVRHEMVEKKGLSTAAADRIHEFVTIKGSAWEVYEQLMSMPSIQNHARAMGAMADLCRLFKYMDAMGYLSYLSFDLSLARGLDYYTGLIYEVVLVNNPYGVGSIGAGGRYDHLVGMFNAGGKDIPCVGISIGVERVFAILEQKAIEAKSLRCTPCSVLVASIGTEMTAHRMRVAAMLWRSGISAEFGYNDNPKLNKQLASALEQGINWVVVVGEEEMKEGKVNLKNLSTHEEITIPVDSIVEELHKQGCN